MPPPFALFFFNDTATTEIYTLSLHDALPISHKLQDGTDYYGINPLGYVPFLVLDDGDTLHEGPAIVQYLADLVPEKKLAPANGTMARYHLQEWLNFIGTELHKGFGPLFNPATPDDYKPVVRQRVLDRLKWVDGELNGRDYLMGEQFTVADAYLYTVTGWRSEEHTSELQSQSNLVCRLLLEKKKKH